MDKSITYNGIRLHYTLEGAGQPLFLLHGWGCNTETFKLIRGFLEQHFLVVAVDFAGFGQSEEPREVWGVEEYTRSVEALAKEERIENPILVGHSFGGRVSIVFASRNNTRKIILTDAAGVKPKRSLTYYRKVYTY
jgi:pimeloyl-ACP methyl ester carboxylesterase